MARGVADAEMDARNRSRLALGARERRLVVVAALGLFWSALLLAVGVPSLLILSLAALAGAGTLAACYGLQGGRLLGNWLRDGSRWFAHDGRRAGSAALVYARASGRRLRSLPWAAAARRAREGWLTAARAGRAGGVAALGGLEQKLTHARKPAASRPDHRIEAWRLNEVGASLRQQGRTAEALERSEAALALFRELGDRRGEALTLNSMGLAQAREGESEAALELFEKALELLAWLGDTHSEGQVLANLGAVNRRQGREEEARSYWRDALARLDPESPEHERIAEQLRLAS
jgi:tetratricopeptide (TPR) repeat protein